MGRCPGGALGASLNDIARAVHETVGRHPSVRSLTLAGSRERGEANERSDWDFEINTDDFDAVTAALPSLVEPLSPLASLWDPLAEHATFMVIVDGPTKIDFIFDEPADQHAPYSVRADTLAAIDAHFWDWCLWLTSKVTAGKMTLVQTELEKLATYILEPFGVADRPHALRDAVDLYLVSRAKHEERFGVRVPRELGQQVQRVVRAVS